MHVIVYRKFVHNDMTNDVVDFNWGGWCKCRNIVFGKVVEKVRTTIRSTNNFLTKVPSIISHRIYEFLDYIT